MAIYIYALLLVDEIANVIVLYLLKMNVSYTHR